MAQRDAHRRRRRPRIVLAAVLLLVMFALGVAIGQAIDDNEVPSGNRTQIRTLVPSTVRPRATVREP